MGYYTTYELAIDSDNEEQIIAELRKDLADANYAIEDDGSPSDCCKWYEYEKDLRAISLKHPDVLFHLTGEGEENGDIWKATFMNGKMHRRKAIITIPAFDKYLLI